MNGLRSDALTTQDAPNPPGQIIKKVIDTLSKPNNSRWSCSCTARRSGLCLPSTLVQRI